MNISDLTISGDNGITLFNELQNRYYDIGFFERGHPRIRAFRTEFTMGKPLTDQELHNLAMNIVGRRLEADGYEFLGVNSKPKKNPQFVCLKEKQLYFVVVRAVSYPEDPKKYDAKLMDKIKKHAESFEAKSCYAGVGLFNSKNPELPVYLNEDYVVDYDGLIEV